MERNQKTSVSDSVILQFLTVFLLVSITFCKQDCGRFSYVTQPPPDLNCNPHYPGITILECIAVGPNYVLLKTEPMMTIKWYREVSSVGQVEEITGTNFPDLRVAVHSKEVVSPSAPTVIGVRSQVHLIRPTNNSEGMYWCQIELEDVNGDGEVMTIEPSRKFQLQSPEFYESLPDCNDRTRYFDVSLECAESLISMISTGTLEEPDSNSTTTKDSEMVPTCSSNSQGETEESQDSIVLPKKWIIIIGCIGGSLLMVVVVLAVFLLMVFVRLRGRRIKTQPITSEIENDRKEVKKPPPVPEKPMSRSSTTTTIVLDSSNQLITGSSTSNSSSQVPLLARGGVRRSLPTRLPLTVKQDEGEEEYTPVLSHRDRKACTLIQKLKVACDQPKNSDKNLDNDSPTNEYHGLNPQMMDDIQPYDHTRGAFGYDESETSDVDSGDDHQHPEYSEPNAHLWSHRERPLAVLSVDGEYVYPNTESAGHKKLMAAHHQEYTPVYDTPDN